MTVRGVIKTTVVTLVALLLIVLIAAFLIVRAIVEPDSDKFGKVKDEAMRAGLTREQIGSANTSRPPTRATSSTWTRDC